MTAKAFAHADAWAHFSDRKPAHKLAASTTADEPGLPFPMLIMAAGWAIPTGPVEFVAGVLIGAAPGTLHGELFAIARALPYFFNAEFGVCPGAGEQGVRHRARLSAAHAHCCAQVVVVGGHRAKHTTPQAVTVS